MYDSFYYDHRVIAGESGKWYSQIDTKKMTAIWYNPETDEDEEIPFEYGVCPTCEGKGSHVNPSIDAHGISAEEFLEDLDFFDDYMSGNYDIPCNECHGMRVVPISDDPRVTKVIEDEYRYQRQYAHERAMGY